MSLHLQEVHKIKKGSEKYYELLKEAQPCKEMFSHMINMESQINISNLVTIEPNCNNVVFEKFIFWSTIWSTS